MATITVRNLDDSIRDRLRQKAAIKGRSMESYVRLILKEDIYKKSKTSNKIKDISNCFKGLNINFKIPKRTSLPKPISL